MAWLDSWNAGLANFIAPSATFAGSGMSPDQVAAAQRAARMQLAAGLLSGVGSGAASPLAKGFAAGLQGVAATNENAMQNAYRNTMLRKQIDREDRLLQAQETELKQKQSEQAAITASRLVQGMETATDPDAYWTMVQNMPEVKAMLQQYGIDPTMAAPHLQQRLSMRGRIGLPYKEETLELKAVVDPKTGKPIYTPETQASGMQPYYESSAGQAGKDEKELFDRANVLADDYYTQTKDFGTIETQYGNVRATARQPSAAGDIALLTSYMKMLDPASTVKEGEFATAEGAAGVPEAIRAKYNKLLTGERLTPEMRADFLTQADAVYKERKRALDKTRRQFVDRSKRAKVDPRDVVGDDEAEPTYTATDPRTGKTVAWINGQWVPQ